MLGLGLTLMGGLLAQDGTDWGQTIMYHPTGDMPATPLGNDTAASPDSRYGTFLFSGGAASGDDTLTRFSLYEYSHSARYSFIHGRSAGLAYNRHSLNFATAFDGEAVMYYQGDTQTRQYSYRVYTESYKNLSFDFSYRKMSWRSGNTEMGSYTIEDVPQWTFRELSACIGKAGQHFGGVYWRNRTRGTQATVFAMRSAEGDSAVYWHETKELSEL